MSQSSLITPTIVLITGHFSNSAKFRGNVKILRNRTNSTARLEILRPAENCGPYLWQGNIWQEIRDAVHRWYSTPYQKMSVI